MNRTNLKIFLSRPWVVWVFWGGAVAASVLLILAEACSDQFAGLRWSIGWIPTSFLLGYFVLGRHDQDDIAAKPLSFVLPGYRESLRTLTFSRAVRWGVAFSLWAFSLSWSRLLFFWEIRQIWAHRLADLPPGVSLPVKPGIAEMSLGAVGGFLGGMALCFGSTISSLAEFRRSWRGLLFVGLEIAMFPALLWFAWSEHVFLVWPILIPLSIFYIVYFWVRLGDYDWVKRGHRAMIANAIEGPSPIVTHVRYDRLIARRRSERRIERLFLGQMRGTSASSIGRYVWAWLYCTFGLILPYWRWLAIPLLVGVVVLGWTSRSLTEVVLLTVGGLVTADILPDTSNMLWPESRRQRYAVAVIAAAFTTALLMTSSAAIGVSSWLLAAVAPPISWRMHHLQYAGIPVASLWLICLPVPWLFLLGPRRHRVPLVRTLVLVVVGVVVIGEILLRDYDFYDGPTLLPALLACGWAFFLLTAWITYTRGDLVGPWSRRDVLSGE